MDAWVGHLRSLQDIDLIIDKIIQTKEDLDRSLAVREAALADEEAKIRGLNDRMKEYEGARKQKEQEFKDAEETIKRWEIRLKELKNYREYQVLTREIALAKKDNAAKEDEILKSLDEEDKIKKELKELEKQHVESQAAFAREKTEAKEKLTGFESTLQEKIRLQGELRGRLTGDLLGKYDRIRKQRNGLVIVGTQSGVCQGCHMNLPPQTVNLVRRNTEMIYCPNCQRILFWEEIRG